MPSSACTRRTVSSMTASAERRRTSYAVRADWPCGSGSVAMMSFAAVGSYRISRSAASTSPASSARRRLKWKSAACWYGRGGGVACPAAHTPPAPSVSIDASPNAISARSLMTRLHSAHRPPGGRGARIRSNTPCRSTGVPGV